MVLSTLPDMGEAQSYHVTSNNIPIIIVINIDADVNSSVLVISQFVHVSLTTSSRAHTVGSENFSRADTSLKINETFSSFWLREELSWMNAICFHYVNKLSNPFWIEGEYSGMDERRNIISKGTFISPKLFLNIRLWFWEEFSLVVTSFKAFLPKLWFKKSRKWCSEGVK